MLFFTFCFFSQSIKSTFCFFEENSSYCPPDLDEILGPTNYSLFDDYIFPFTDRVKISIAGKINHVFSLNHIYERHAFEIIGNRELNNSIILNNSQPINHQIELDTVYVYLSDEDTTVNVTIDDLLLFESRISTNQTMNLTVINFTTDTFSLMSLDEISVDNNFEILPITYVIEEVHYCVIHMRNNQSVSISSIECDYTIGLFYNAMLLYQDPDNPLYLQFPEDVMDISIEHSDGSELSLINILSYGFMTTISSISIILSGNARLHFLPCNWPKTNFFNIKSTGSSTLVFDISYIPASITSNKGSVAFVLFRPQSTIVGQLDIEQTLTISKDEEMETAILDVNDFIMSEGASVHTSSGITFEPSHITINSTSGLFLSGNGFFVIEEIFSKNYFSLEISNLRITSNLNIRFQVTDKQSAILLDFIDYQSGDVNFVPLDLSVNPPYFQEQFTVFKLTTKSQTKVMNYYLNWGNHKYVYQNGTNYFSVKTETQDTSYIVNGITLDYDVYSSWCFGVESLCPAVSRYVNLNEYSEWPFASIDMIKSLKFFVTDNSYDGNGLNFQKLIDRPLLDIQIKGIENSKFVFDSSIYHIFKRVTSTNASLQLSDPYISKSNVKNYLLINSTVHPALEISIKKAPSVLLDSYTASYMIGSSRFNGNVTLLCNDNTVTVKKGCVIIRGREVPCKNVSLFHPSAIIGMFEDVNEDAEINISIQASKPITIKGNFPNNWTMKITSAPEIISEVSDPHLSISTTEGVDIKFTSPQKHVIISKIHLLCKVTINMPESSTLMINDITVGDKGEIEKSNENIRVLIPILQSCGKSFYPSKIGYNNLVKTTTLGTTVTFTKDEHIPMTLELLYSLSDMPNVVLRNGSYNEVQKIVFIHQTDSLVDEEYVLKTIPYPFVNGFPILCGTTINCKNWTYEYQSENRIFREEIYAKCIDYKTTNCVFLYGSDNLLPKDPIYHNLTPIYCTFFGIAGSILIIGIIALLISMKLHKKQEHQFSYSPYAD